MKNALSNVGYMIIFYHFQCLHILHLVIFRSSRESRGSRRSSELSFSMKEVLELNTMFEFGQQVQYSAVQYSAVHLLQYRVTFNIDTFRLGPNYTQTYELTEFIFATQTFNAFKPTFIYSTSQVLYVKAVVFKRLKGYAIFISTNKQSGYELFFPTIIF